MTDPWISGLAGAGLSPLPVSLSKQPLSRGSTNNVQTLHSMPLGDKTRGMWEQEGAGCEELPQDIRDRTCKCCSQVHCHGWRPGGDCAHLGKTQTLLACPSRDHLMTIEREKLWADKAWGEGTCELPEGSSQEVRQNIYWSGHYSVFYTHSRKQEKAFLFVCFQCFKFFSSHFIRLM